MAVKVGFSGIHPLTVALPAATLYDPLSQSRFGDLARVSAAAAREHRRCMTNVKETRRSEV
jgi:hypothetical protein